MDNKSKRTLIIGSIFILSCYLLYAIKQNYDYGVSFGPMLTGVGRYHAQRHDWPSDYADVELYMDAPYAVERMAPRFAPEGVDSARMSVRDWSYLVPLRANYLLTVDSSGRVTAKQE